MNKKLKKSTVGITKHDIFNIRTSGIVTLSVVEPVAVLIESVQHMTMIANA